MIAHTGNDSTRTSTTYTDGSDSTGGWASYHRDRDIRAMKDELEKWIKDCLISLQVFECQWILRIGMRLHLDFTKENRPSYHHLYGFSSGFV